MLKKHGDTQDPPPERSQRTCQSLHNFPRPSSTKTNGIYTPPSPGTTNSSIHLKKKVNLLVLCQPLDKAVYCKLQVSMTWALEHSDKAVTANSELAFSVGNSEGQPTRGRVLILYTQLHAWRNHQHRLNQTYKHNKQASHPLNEWIPCSFLTLQVASTQPNFKKKNNQMEMITIAGPGTPMANHLNQGIRLYG